MENLNAVALERKNKIKIQRPQAKTEEEKLHDEVRRFVKMVPDEPDPNMGRVQEIKEQIKKGTYLTDEMIQDTAAILASRLFRSELDH